MRLRAEDLADVVVADGPAPLLELADHVRRHHARGRALLGPDADLLRVLLTSPCTPGFLQPHAVDPGEALDAACSVPTAQARRDLADNAAAGYPMPPWAVEFGRAGTGSVQLRRRLRRVLAHGLRETVAPLVDDAAPVTSARVGRLRGLQDAHGPSAALRALGSAVRLQDDVLEVDLVSGAEVDAVSAGTGLTLVPTLGAHATVTVSSTGGRTVVAFPATGPDEVDAVAVHDVEALEALVGTTRARLLVELARSPSLGVRALARASGVSPATASHHLSVLRAARLVVTAGPGNHVTALGRRLIEGG